MEWTHFNDNDTKSGVEGRWYLPSPHRATFYIHPTNHKDDWKSNFRTLRRVRLRDNIKVNKQDLIEAQWIVEYIRKHLNMEKLEVLKVGGYSRGGALAAIVAWKMKERYPQMSVEGILIAPKRTGNKAFTESIKHYCRGFWQRGDIVPFLPLWPRYRNINLTTFGRIQFFTRAHLLTNYYRFIDKYGLR